MGLHHQCSTPSHLQRSDPLCTLKLGLSLECVGALWRHHPECVHSGSVAADVRCNRCTLQQPTAATASHPPKSTAHSGVISIKLDRGREQGQRVLGAHAAAELHEAVCLVRVVVHHSIRVQHEKAALEVAAALALAALG